MGKLNSENIMSVRFDEPDKVTLGQLDEALLKAGMAATGMSIEAMLLGDDDAMEVAIVTMAAVGAYIEFRRVLAEMTEVNIRYEKKLNMTDDSNNPKE